MYQTSRGVFGKWLTCLTWRVKCFDCLQCPVIADYQHKNEKIKLKQTMLNISPKVPMLLGSCMHMLTSSLNICWL